MTAMKKLIAYLLVIAMLAVPLCACDGPGDVTDPNNTDTWDDNQMVETIRHCDKHNVPVATNLASAEMLIMGLQRGDLDWREMLHSKPRF